ncbi:MAG: hypothetical protein ACKVT0_20765 [Planctomycetaceae bacterium]
MAKPATALSIIKQSRKDLNSLKSIRATLDETVSFGPKRFRATGTYVQGTELKLKLEYTLSLGGSKGTLIEVCDGQVLWAQQTIDKDIQLTRRDVRQILEVAKSLPRKDSVMLHTELGLGGLPALLASLEQSMTFKPGPDETLENRHFTVLEGRWNKEYQQLWTGGSRDSKTVLPPYIPDRVRVYMEQVPHQDRTIHFPTRIIYLKKTDPEKATFRPLVTLQFNDIVLDGAVSDDEFQFDHPEGVIPEDVTQAYIQQLKPQQPSAAPSATNPAKTPKAP